MALASALALAGVLASAVPAAGQVFAAQNRVTGFVEAEGAFVTLARSSPTVIGGAVGLTHRTGWSLWGGGAALTFPLDLIGAVGPIRLNLFRAGVGVERAWEVAAQPRLTPTASLMIGSAHGVVQSRATGAELGSENLLTLEGTGGARYTLHPNVALGLRGGYRWVAGADELPGLPPGTLRGWTLSLSLRLRQQP
jgi:hypothetical protein